MMHSKVRIPHTPYILLTTPFIAVINAHDKANTLHRAVNLENIILYMDIDGTSRAGHLVNWDLSCKTNSPPISASKLPVRRNAPQHP